ncbi:MAG: regulatory protein RecX [Nocardioidaceae bacterium]
MARTIVLRRLTAAPRTRAQLADDLRRRDVPDAVADRVLARFGEVGLVDDEAYAQAWVRSRHTGKGLSRRALAQELRKRGVDDATVDAAVEEIDSDREATAAAALVARRLPATRHLPVETRMRRLTGVLARKGYSGGLAMAVVRDALVAERESSGDERPGW